MEPAVRLACAKDLSGVLDLFKVSEVSLSADPRSRAEQIWQETLRRPGVSVFLSEAGDTIVATCMLVVVPNLLRSGRQHGFIENVVTHPDFRGHGYGTAVMAAALE